MAILDKIKNKKSEKTTEKKAVKKVLVEENKEVVPATANKISVVRDTSTAFKVILKPVVSEKSNTEEAKGTYTFIVSERTNKVEIKKAINDIYGVLPIKVRTLIVEGKAKRFGKSRGRRSNLKKAFVTLPKGKSINTHEGV
ncbi:MAG: 50S ribosomal protein L23 [Candidatus Magasanikbacteria bacterium CG_4_9_14_3_um_filter_32_9]|uniref:Large ribosomal subunit protein uL23 n=1 Tax=Candidatus Magasanikbacteria bacterium CG_4_9_14_3_um_filter_32_9 TaxID=1974644 RepID=A0A2M7Z7G3_9BACT|nr:MAG: 50S ribosomal protein L23 [Candidatus Magasanikbacteria bacterium CG_4_9_14_3_um_filter_32_9]